MEQKFYSFISWMGDCPACRILIHDGAIVVIVSGDDYRQGCMALQRARMAADCCFDLWVVLAYEIKGRVFPYDSQAKPVVEALRGESR